MLTREAALGWAGLLAAYRDARRGKRYGRAAGAWFRDWEVRLLRLRERLLAGYAFGPYRSFVVCDPKPRAVAAAPFEDRVVHHRIVALIGPRLERGMIPTSVACRTGLGGAAARDALLRACRSGKATYFAKADVRSYFASIRHDRLLARVARACGDNWARELVASLVASWHTPGAPGSGIPIGNLTSQLFANVLLDEVDHFMVRTAGARGYVRYVDDMVWFGQDKPALWAQVDALRGRLDRLGLELHPGKTRVGRVSDGVDFAGFVATADWLRLRGATKRRALRHLAETRRRWRRGRATDGEYVMHIGSFVALARRAGAKRLLAKRGLAW